MVRDEMWVQGIGSVIYGSGSANLKIICGS